MKSVDFVSFPDLWLLMLNKSLTYTFVIEFYSSNLL